MQHFKKYTILPVLAVLMFASCSVNDYKQLEFKSYDIASVSGFSYSKGSIGAEIVIDVEVANPTKSQFVLESLDAVLYKEDGSTMATATALERAVILPQSDTLVPLRLDAVLLNPMATMLSNGIALETLTVDIDAMVRSGSFSKRITKRGYPLSEISGSLKAAPQKTDSR